MEPPPFGDGRPGPSGAAPRTALGFNGATAFRRWKASASRCRSQHGPRLQWSHRLSAMEDEGDSAEALRWFELQWSHRLSAMEDVILHRPLVVAEAASMEPPPLGDGRPGGFQP